MTRFTLELLGALVVVGCGSSAMAAPGHGYWTGYDDQNQTTPYQDPNQSQNQNQNQATPQPYPYQQSPQAQPQSAGATDPWDDQDEASPQAQSQNQNQPQAQPPSQSQSQAPGDDEDEDEDTADTAPNQARLGVLVLGMTPELRRHFGAPANRGVLIAQVESNSAAARAGLMVGDVLVRVDRRPVRSREDVVQALAAHGSGRIRLSVIRQDQLVRLDATISGPPRQRLEHPTL